MTWSGDDVRPRCRVCGALWVEEELCLECERDELRDELRAEVERLLKWKQLAMVQDQVLKDIDALSEGEFTGVYLDWDKCGWLSEEDGKRFNEVEALVKKVKEAVERAYETGYQDGVEGNSCDPSQVEGEVR